MRGLVARVRLAICAADKPADRRAASRRLSAAFLCGAFAAQQPGQYDPGAGMDEDGRIERPDLPADLTNPERWRYTPPGRIAPGSQSDHVSVFEDIMPTLAELAGAEVPDNCDGLSLLPTLLGDADAQRQHDCLIWDFPGYGGQLAVRKGKWTHEEESRLRKGVKALGVGKWKKIQQQ